MKLFIKKAGFILLFVFFLLLFSYRAAFSQRISNIRVTQDGTNVSIVYDLKGVDQVYDVYLFYKMNHDLSWEVPIEDATGDIGENIQPGKDKHVSFKLMNEKDLKVGYFKFKVDAEVYDATFPVESVLEDLEPKSPMLIYKSKRNLSAAVAIVSTGIGIYAYVQETLLYDDYQSATYHADELHSKINTYNLIAPIAFSIAGVSTVSFFIYSSKYKKAKKELDIKMLPLQNGGGLAISFKF